MLESRYFDIDCHEMQMQREQQLLQRESNQM